MRPGDTEADNRLVAQEIVADEARTIGENADNAEIGVVSRVVTA